MAYSKEILDIQGSPMETLVFTPDSGEAVPGVVIAQHIPNAHISLEGDPFTIDIGERMVAAGYACVIPYIFHWWPSDEEILVKREAWRDDRCLADMRAAYDLLAGLDQVDAGRIGVLGHCWGGRVAWIEAANNPGYKTSVVLYGGRVKIPLGEGAEPPIEMADRIKCPMLGVFGNNDQNPSPEDVDDMDAALTAAGVTHTFHRYDGAGHGFQDFVTEDRYCKEQSDDAWGKIMTFLDDTL